MNKSKEEPTNTSCTRSWEHTDNNPVFTAQCSPPSFSEPPWVHTRARTGRQPHCHSHAQVGKNRGCCFLPSLSKGKRQQKSKGQGTRKLVSLHRSEEEHHLPPRTSCRGRKQSLPPCQASQHGSQIIPTWTFDMRQQQTQTDSTTGALRYYSNS